MAGWSAIVSPARSSKREVVDALCRALRARGLAVAGFSQPLVRDSAGTPIGWDVENLATGERVPLARHSTRPDVCGYAFDRSAFETAARWLREPADVLVAEGVGKLEAAGGGHWPAISAVVSEPGAPHLVLGIRDTCLATIVLELPDPEAHIQLPATDVERAAFADGIAALVFPRTSRAG